MMESICRALRDGALEGEHAPALTIKDSIASPFGFDVFAHVLLSLLPTFWLESISHNPLGWKDGVGECGSGPKLLLEASNITSFCKNMKDVEKLFSMIIELGLVGQDKDRFFVAIDSVSEMLRHASISSVAGFLSKLRSHGNWKSLSLLEQNSTRGKIFARFKRRNGRVRVVCEEFHVEQSRINLASVSSEDGKTSQSLLPKFNLQLSEKERIDRSKVVLPFEHQGNETNEESSKGEIIYFRDSEYEMPDSDSDEDPDDDLDI
ncbi:hypothetical protein FNV43_RR17002 [Rhamnella rubrinervis]|uniref:Elongator complex protein 5 n=1 Tax=Rhamnella rubrinervis TaxID=2594499 RepID=A0A8K0GZU9_9ROSA|nr:hypothetical protein FNV43_RR17002 [Rhamnella rubrinervis]